MSYLLVSNDDGVHAPGLAALVEATCAWGEVQVVAPTENMSGASSKLTLNRPLTTQTLANGFIAVDGTPTDCVHLALNGLLERCPDMVVSGINAGANLGDDVLYSGTVAAAIEGRYLSRPALAVSQVNRHTQDWSTAVQVVSKLMDAWVHFDLPEYTLLNVNIPDLAYDQIRGFKVTRLGRRRKSAEVHAYRNPRGQLGYWIGLAGEGEDAGEDTDFHAIASGYVSVTPLTVDMTRHEVLAGLNEWSRSLNEDQVVRGRD